MLLSIVPAADSIHPPRCNGNQRLPGKLLFAPHKP
jgi:hypothetical protein